MTAHTASSAPETHHLIERVRYELKRRILTVKSVQNVTPQMLRVTLTGDDLGDFNSLGYDDHIKIVIPKSGEEPTFPVMGADGRLVVDPDNKPILRDYTPRRFDVDARELDIDFALHDAGPATEWAANAKPGDKLGVGGPRGSLVVASDFDWYLLVGDETALPAIGRRLEQLPAGTKAVVIVEVEGPQEEQALTSKADLSLTWLHRGTAPSGTTDLADQALRGLAMPEGDGYVFIAAETLVSKRLRAIMVDEKGHPKTWIKAAGYWKRGQADFHETHSD